MVSLPLFCKEVYSVRGSRPNFLPKILDEGYLVDGDAFLYIFVAMSSQKEVMVRSILRHLYSKLRSFVLSKRFGYIIASFVALFLLMNYAVLPWYVYHGGTLTVPDVTEMQFVQASETLRTMGLVPIEGDKILDNAHPIGTVVTQNPHATSVVKYGRHVYLTVCGGEVQVSVPSLRGRSLRDARFALERNGLLLGDIQYAASDSSPVNTIITQTIAATERVKKGMPIGVTLSTGSLTRTIAVPNLSGKSFTEAEKILDYFGLRLGNVTYQVNIELLPNTIVDQFPIAGTAVDSGKTVDVFVVKAGTLQDEH